MIKKKAFTLIELLVVISIIALLLSILVPALGVAKKQAQNVVCKSNLHQWGMAWKIYTEENNGKFPNLKNRVEETNSGAMRSYWSECLGPYLGEGSRGEGIYFCPSATRGQDHRASDEFTSFNLAKMDAEDGLSKRASYGINCWVYDGFNNSALLQNAWIRDDATSNPSQVPMLMDSKWRGGVPLETDLPLQSGDLIVDQKGVVVSTGESVGQMGYFQMKRHKHGINAVFLDTSIRAIEPKELWTLKWHKSFDTRSADRSMTWPDWMD